MVAVLEVDRDNVLLSKVSKMCVVFRRMKLKMFQKMEMMLAVSGKGVCSELK